MKRYQRYYKYINQLILITDSNHSKLINDPWMPLSVECWKEGPDKWIVSLCHYGEQNGDLMRDPEVCFRVSEGHAVPCSFRNDYAGFDEIIPLGKRSVGLDQFCDKWFKNIKEQGFFDVARGGEHETTTK